MKFTPLYQNSQLKFHLYFQETGKDVSEFLSVKVIYLSGTLSYQLCYKIFSSYKLLREITHVLLQL